MTKTSETYRLYYTDTRGRGTIFYARRRPGDGGCDWEYTTDAKLAGAFKMHHLQAWVKLHGKKAGWNVLSSS